MTTSVVIRKSRETPRKRRDLRYTLAGRKPESWARKSKTVKGRPHSRPQVRT